MCKIILVLSLVGFVCGEPQNNDTSSSDCDPKCKGPAYRCIEGQCFCSIGYVPNPTQSRCVRCPGYGESCYGVCCNHDDNVTLSCWQGYCQPCYDNRNRWICRDSLDHILVVSSTQVAMATALVLGIIATFVLLYKICAVTAVRPLGGISGSETRSRLSIGSLQFYIEERLRDAPPSGKARTYKCRRPVGWGCGTRGGRKPSPTPNSIELGFLPPLVPQLHPTGRLHLYTRFPTIHDGSTQPPPPYTPEKEENQSPAPTVHI